MKKSLRIYFYILNVVLLFGNISAIAQTQFQIGSIANATTATVTIPITTTNFTQFLAIQGSINWDNSKLTYSSVTNLNSQLTGTTFNSSISGSTGRLSYVWTDASLNPQTLASNAVLFNLVLSVVPTAVGTVTLSFTNTPTPLLVADNNLNTVAGVVYSSGSVTIPWALPTGINLFTANKNNNNVILKWSTTIERNTAYFEVEKSNNGTDFFSIHKTIALGNNLIDKQYSFIDIQLANPTVKTIYYRIKTTDNDGAFVYSRIVSIRNDDKESNLVVYPIPTKQHVNVQVKSEVSQTATVQIADMFGKIVEQLQVQLNVGSTSFSLSTLNLAAGNYSLIIKGNTIMTRKIVIE